MAEAQKPDACDLCGHATGKLETFLVPSGRPATAQRHEPRWRVRCEQCGHMTPHFGAACLALAVWNERTGQREDKLAG